MALTDEAIAQIKEMIVSGALKPGDRLPKENELAEQLGLSRSSLREAVRALSLIRVLDVRQGDGTYVSTLEPGLLLEAMKFVLDLHHDDTVLAIIEARRIIEPIVTGMAAARITDDGILELRTLLASVTNASSDVEFLAMDLEFHARIAGHCGNTILCSILSGVSAPTTRARIWRLITQENALERTLWEHRMICDALEARRPDLAQAWATTHILGVEEWLRRAL